MIIKSFVADSVAGALKMVRSELGGDAVILKTRKLDPTQQTATNAKVEVTACIDQSPVARVAKMPQAPILPDSSSPGINPAERHYPPKDIPAEAIVQKLDFLIDILQMPLRKSAFPGNIGGVFTALLQADMPEAIAFEMAEKLTDRFGETDDYRRISSAACDLLLDRMPEQRGPFEFNCGQKIILVGPPGCGKTSLMGRLAGYLIAQKKLPVCLTSLDRVKVSAPEELQSYAAILDVEHFEMPHRIDRSLLERQGQDKIVLIDTPALDTRDQSAIEAFAEKINGIKPDRVIGVFPATFRTSDLLDMIRAFRPLILTGLAITMVDQTNRLGGVTALSILSGLPIEILGTGHKADSIDLSPDYKRIIESFLGTQEGKRYE